MSTIRKSTPPNLNNQPNVDLMRKPDFEGLIWHKGYEVIIKQAISCPCRGKSGSPKPACGNCLGLGWFFVNPVETRAIISSINKDTKYKYWSPELTGTINITVRDEERLSYMDMITFKDRTTVHSEVKSIIDSGTQKFVFCSYTVKSIRGVYIFNTDSTKLTKLSADKYTILTENNRVIQLSNVIYPTGFNGVISVEYEHELAYNIVDMPHDFRSTFMLNDHGQNVEFSMPVQGVARRSHLVIGESTNYNGNNLLDNSYI